ncbi:MAG: hypothetical protein CM15mP78_03290 [Candidatus Poseidoniales archaeon]|nr:MAG: hypothetical protein CM15mP78_03290 [Candidatus Poseidoniales archaeon]
MPACTAAEPTDSTPLMVVNSWVVVGAMAGVVEGFALRVSSAFRPPSEAPTGRAPPQQGDRGPSRARQAHGCEMRHTGGGCGCGVGLGDHANSLVVLRPPLIMWCKSLTHSVGRPATHHPAKIPSDRPPRKPPASRDGPMKGAPHMAQKTLTMRSEVRPLGEAFDGCAYPRASSQPSVFSPDASFACAASHPSPTARAVGRDGGMPSSSEPKVFAAHAAFCITTFGSWAMGPPTGRGGSNPAATTGDSSSCNPME